MSRRAALPGLLALVLVAALPACDDTDMAEQPSIKPYDSSALFSNGQGMRPPLPGTVALEDADAGAAMPARIDAALLARGAERFGIYCTPCHGQLGDGRGMIVARGFPAPPSFHERRLRAAKAQHFVDVIANGYGVMYRYAARVNPADRWAIAAHIRALQLSQDIAVAGLPTNARAELAKVAP